jgi:hypothetical protein
VVLSSYNTCSDALGRRNNNNIQIETTKNEVDRHITLLNTASDDLGIACVTGGIIYYLQYFFVGFLRS